MESDNVVIGPPSAVRGPGMLEIAWQIRKLGTLPFFMQQWRKQGDLGRLRIAGITLQLAVHPEHVRQIFTKRDRFEKLKSWQGSRERMLGDGLIASTGKLWKRQRRLMSPFFTPRSVEQYHGTVLSACEALAQRWEASAAARTPRDVLDDMTRVTATIILRSMFGTAVEEQRLRSLADDVERMITFGSRYERSPLQLPLWAPLPDYQRYRAARARVGSMIHELTRRRRALPQASWPNDLLSKLMLARDDETGEAMSDDLLHDEALGIFVAGHETTARTMGFFWYALHQHPEVAERVHAEVDAVLERDQAPTIEQLRQLPYTTRVLKEVLRLYPATPMLPRDPVGEQELSGLAVPANTYVMLFPYATHRHPEFWEDPERFDPDRFLPEREAARHPFAYFPFGGGPRICLGSSFAMLEAQVLAAMLARRFRARLVDGHRPRIDVAGTLVIENGLPMRLTRR